MTYHGWDIAEAARIFRDNDYSLPERDRDGGLFGPLSPGQLSTLHSMINHAVGHLLEVNGPVEVQAELETLVSDIYARRWGR
jgi:hypothetical protein